MSIIYPSLFPSISSTTYSAIARLAVNPGLSMCSCGLSRAAFVHSISVVTHFGSLQSRSFTHSLVGFRGCEDIGLSIELTDAQGGVTIYFIE